MLLAMQCREQRLLALHVQVIKKGWAGIERVIERCGAREIEATVAQLLKHVVAEAPIFEEVEWEANLVGSIGRGRTMPQE